ncbi:Crp/Fnr family transcriptional regulator [Clostridium sp. BJN0001]|uniref:Crp/Fnr family transcriptional regulator n=1 Tax=Clostridium sp. BJN0001 TaxID=2930219 RepID=UPI001FD1D373|nr:Crp/Fnr family transcriptional regulator [Clostridium sp. BJN0001]
MNSEFLIDFLEKNNTPTIKRKYHSYLTFCGLDEQYTYVLKKGTIKTSIILKDGREFNMSYICAPDIISLVRDEVSVYTSSPFNVRIESEEAVFYRIPRVTFWNYVNSNKKLQEYVKDYYRHKLLDSMYNEKIMIMNSKKGAVCAFLHKLINKFGKETDKGIRIEFPITNEDIAGFCGISTRNSVNRILHELKEEAVIDIIDNKIHIIDADYMQRFT